MLPDPAMVFAVFPDLDAVQPALDELLEAGFSRDQLEITGPADLQPGDISPAGRILTALGGRQRSSGPGSLSERLRDLGAERDEADEYEACVAGGQLLVSLVAMRRSTDAGAILAKHSSVTGLAETRAAADADGLVVVREEVRSRAARPPAEIPAR